jgi:hypothetical protein
MSCSQRDGQIRDEVVGRVARSVGDEDVPVVAVRSLGTTSIRVNHCKKLERTGSDVRLNGLTNGPNLIHLQQ